MHTSASTVWSVNFAPGQMIIDLCGYKQSEIAGLLPYCFAYLTVPHCETEKCCNPVCLFLGSPQSVYGVTEESQPQSPVHLPSQPVRKTTKEDFRKQVSRWLYGSSSENCYQKKSIWSYRDISKNNCMFYLSLILTCLSLMLPYVKC